MMPLQTLPDFCTSGYTLQDYLSEFRFIDGFACSGSEMAGGAVVLATLVFGGIGLSIYIRTGSMALPGILLLLTGGAIISTLAVPAVGIVTLLILVVAAGSMTYAYWRYSR